MKASRIAPLVLAVLPLLSMQARGERTDIKTKSGDTFIVTYPKSIRCETENPPEGTTAAFTLHYADDKGVAQLVFQVLIDHVDKEEDWKDQEAADQFLEAAGTKNLEKSVEKNIVPVHYKPVAGFGSYTVFTDASLGAKEPKAGDFRLMVMGVIRRGKHLILLRGYANSATEDYFRIANAVLEKIEIAPAAGGN